MRKIFLFLLFIVSFQAFGQPTNYTHINGRYRWQGGMFDSGLHIPRYNGTPVSTRTNMWIWDGAIAADTTNHRLYLWSNSTWNRIANFTEIAGASANISNTSLTANGDYTQSWAGKQFKFDSIGIYTVQSRTASVTPRYTVLGNKALSIGYDIYSQFNDANGTSIQMNNSSGGSNTYIESFATNSTNLSSFQVLPDSIVFKPDAGAMTIDSLRVANSDTNGYKPMVWNQFNKSWRYFNSWGELGLGTGPSWLLAGNAVAGGIVDFFGSTNNRSVRVRANNTHYWTFDSLGRFEVNNPAFISNGDNIVAKAKNSSAFNYNLFLSDASNSEVFSVSNNDIVQVGNFKSFVVGGSSATATFNGASSFNSTLTVNNITGLTVSEMSTPSTPASGFARVYPKSDGLWYGKDDAGVETKLSNIGTTGGIDDVLAVGQALTTSRTINTNVSTLTISGSNSGYLVSAENSNAGSNSYGIRGLATGGGKAGTMTVLSSGTNDEKDVLDVQRETSSTAAAGLSGTIRFPVETSDGNPNAVAKIKSVLTVADVNSYSGKLTFSTYTDTEQHNSLELSGPKNTLYTRDSTVDHTVEREAMIGDYKTLTESSATAFVRVNIPTGQVAGGEILITVEANDATDFQARTVRVLWSAVNKAGTITRTLATAEEVVAVSAGTLTVTIDSNDAGSGNLDFRANAVSSLTQTTLRANHQIRKNFSTGTITAQ